MNIFSKIKNPQELLDFFEKNMKYGFTCGDKVFVDTEPDFQKNMDKLYKLRVGEDFIKSGYGVCWDFCEFERLYFEKKKIPHECYFYLSFYAHNQGGPTHTFLLFNQNKKWFWFEFSWLKYRGIWEYASKEDALKDILEKFIDFFDRNFEKVEVYKTTKAKAGLNTFEFVEHCLAGEEINLK